MPEYIVILGRSGVGKTRFIYNNLASFCDDPLSVIDIGERGFQKNVSSYGSHEGLETKAGGPHFELKYVKLTGKAAVTPKNNNIIIDELYLLHPGDWRERVKLPASSKVIVLLQHFEDIERLNIAPRAVFLFRGEPCSLGLSFTKFWDILDDNLKAKSFSSQDSEAKTTFSRVSGDDFRDPTIAHYHYSRT
jgi:hypothetical protein